MADPTKPGRATPAEKRNVEDMKPPREQLKELRESLKAHTEALRKSHEERVLRRAVEKNKAAIAKPKCR
jgi:hypothetical protein